MANFNNFNDIKKYIDDSISGIQLPDHYKGQILVYTETLVPLNETYLGEVSKVLRTFVFGDTWLVGSTKTLYVFDGTVWAQSEILVTSNGDFYFASYFLDADDVTDTIQIQANIIWNEASTSWDIARDLYYQPDGTYLLADMLTGSINVSDKLKSYHDALGVVGTTNTINFLVQKTDGSVGVEKRTLIGTGFIQVADGVLSVDPTSYISTLVVNGGAGESGKYVSAISVAGNTFTVTKVDLPTPPTLNDLSGQPYAEILDSLSTLVGASGFISINYVPGGTTPETRWAMSITTEVVTNSILTTVLADYQPKTNILTKLSAYTGAMVNGNDYIVNLHQNSATIGDFTVTVDNRANIINFGVDVGVSGADKFISDLTKDATGKLVRTYTSALTTLGLTNNTITGGQAFTGVTYSGGNLTFTKGSFLTALSKAVTIGTGNVVTELSVSVGEITLTKGITALTEITKPMVEVVLIGEITSHIHATLYDSLGSASSALVTANTYTDTEVSAGITDLLTVGTANHNSLLAIIEAKVNLMIAGASFPDEEDPV